VSVQCLDRVGNYVFGRGKGIMYLVIVIRQGAYKSVIVHGFQVLLLCFVVYNKLKFRYCYFSSWFIIG
jgi:hypothetical protein